MKLFGEFNASHVKTVDKWLLEDCEDDDTIRIFRQKGNPLITLSNKAKDLFILRDEDKIPKKVEKPKEAAPAKKASEVKVKPTATAPEGFTSPTSAEEVSFPI